MNRPCTLSLPAVAATLLLPAALAGQTIRGSVVEDGTRAPVVGAVVELVGASAVRARSDSVGGFVLEAPRRGRYGLRVSHPSYTSAGDVALEVGRGETLVELRLGRSAIPLEPLVVATRGGARLSGFYERMKQPGFGTFVGREEIELRMGTTRATDLLRNIAGVEIVPVKVGESDRALAPGPLQETIQTKSLITLRGGTGRCMPAIFVDGMAVSQFNDSGVDDILKPEMLEGVEVYTSAAGIPPQFANGSHCGAVAFWTRSDGGAVFTWKRLLRGAPAFALIALAVLATR